MTAAGRDPAAGAAPVGVRRVRAWRSRRADVRRARLVQAQLGPEPGAASGVAAAPTGLRSRARSLWCGFVSGLG